MLYGCMASDPGTQCTLTYIATKGYSLLPYGFFWLCWAILLQQQLGNPKFNFWQYPREKEREKKVCNNPKGNISNICPVHHPTSINGEKGENISWGFQSAAKKIKD